jgi:hypothetical protein
MGAEMSTQAGAKQPTHEDWKRAKDLRESEARKTVQALLDGRIDAARQHALKSDAADDLTWSISKILDEPGEEALRG